MIRVADSDGRLRNIRCDFLVTLKDSHQVLVELDGNHHFGPFSYGSGDVDLDGRFRDQIRRDLCKNRYVLANGLSLLRISYKEYNTLQMAWEEFISQYNRSGKKQTFVASNKELYNRLKETGLNLGIK